MRKEDEEEKEYNKDEKNKEVMHFKEETKKEPKKGPVKEINPRRPNCRKRQKPVASLSEKPTAFKRVDTDLSGHLKKESDKLRIRPKSVYIRPQSLYIRPQWREVLLSLLR